MKIKKGSKWLCIKEVSTVCKKGVIYESGEDYSIMGEDDVYLWDTEEDVIRNHFIFIPHHKRNHRAFDIQSDKREPA